MKEFFKKFKPSAFGILFAILVVVTIATWFVPAGEYVYQCQDQDAFVYKQSNGKQKAVCPINTAELDQLTLINAKGGDDVVNEIETLIANNDATSGSKRQEAEYVYHELPPQRQGIWNVITAPIQGFINAIEIIAFVFVIGGFINIVIKSGAMDAGIYALLKRFKGYELALIPILMTLFALGGTSFGMAEETLVFYVILIPVLFRAGFDNAVGMMIIGLGAGVGVLCSSVNPFAIGVASTAVGISPGDGIIGRLCFFVIMLSVTILYVLHYARKVKKDPRKSITYEQRSDLEKEFNSQEVQEIKLTFAHKVILILFALTFILMIMSIIPWESAFNITFFADIAASINNMGFPFLGGDGGILPFGEWYFVEMSALFLAASFIVGVIARSKNLIKEPIVSVFIEGAKDMVSVGLIIGLARGIQGILEASGMAPTVLYYSSQLLANLPKALFIIITYIFYLPLSFLVPSTSGLATATMPIVGDLAYNVFGDVNGKIQAITAFSAASGIVNLITPTSGVIMAGLQMAKMDFGKWIKLITPLLIILFLLTIAFLTFTSITGFGS